MNAGDADQNFLICVTRVHLRLIMFKKLAPEGRATMLRLKIRLTEKWFRHRIRDTFQYVIFELHAVSLTYSNRGKLSSRSVEGQVPSLKSGSCVSYPI